MAFVLPEIADSMGVSINGNNRMPGLVSRGLLVVGVLFLSTMLSACRSGDGMSSPVLGAVFGVDNAPSVPYRVGRIPDPTVRPADKVVGDAANNPGQCIFQRPSGARFRANCPEGYAIGDKG